MDAMIAFVVERVVVSTPDILIAGFSGYLSGRGHERGRGIGAVILVLYGIAIVGGFMGAADEGKSLELFGPICGLLSACLMAWLAHRRSA